MEKERIGYIDLAKGFCILLVVFYHALNSYDIHEYVGADMMRVFRMPLYFFLSGLFFKPYENYVGFLKRKVNKLFIPFLTFYALIVLTTTYIRHFIGDKVLDNVWQPLYAFIWPEQWEHNVPLWFLVCLFVLNNLFYLIYLFAQKVGRSHWLPVLCTTTILIGISGYLLGIHQINLPFFLDSAMTALPFFVLGYLIRKYTNFLQPNRMDRWNPLIVVVGFLYCFLLGKYENFRLQEYETNIFVLYSTGILGTLAVLQLSKMIGRLPFVSYCGRYSIMILLIHRPIVSQFTALFIRLGIPTGWGILLVFVLTMAICSSLIPFLKKYCGYVTAQKDLLKV